MIKQIVGNPSIVKYILSNPYCLLNEKYDSVVANALYGDIVDVPRGKGINIIRFHDFLKKYNIKIDKTNIEFPIIQPDTTGSSVKFLETQVICTVIKGTNSKRVFEIGTFEGATTTNIAHNIDELGQIYSLCLPQCECNFIVGKYVKKDRKSMGITELLIGDSLTFDFLPYYNNIDLMFIDGSHSYEYVVSDSENAIRCVRSDGFIIWHDFDVNHLGSVKAIYETCKKHNLLLYRIDDTSLAITKNVKSLGIKRDSEEMNDVKLSKYWEKRISKHGLSGTGDISLHPSVNEMVKKLKLQDIKSMVEFSEKTVLDAGCGLKEQY